MVEQVTGVTQQKIVARIVAMENKLETVAQVQKQQIAAMQLLTDLNTHITQYPNTLQRLAEDQRNVLDYCANLSKEIESLICLTGANDDNDLFTAPVLF